MCLTEYSKCLVNVTSKQQVCYAWQVSDLFSQTCFIKYNLTEATQKQNPRPSPQIIKYFMYHHGNNLFFFRTRKRS